MIYFIAYMAMTAITVALVFMSMAVGGHRVRSSDIPTALIGGLMWWAYLPWSLWKYAEGRLK